jgi:hypothetical protein
VEILRHFNKFEAATENPTVTQQFPHRASTSQNKGSSFSIHKHEEDQRMREWRQTLLWARKTRALLQSFVRMVSVAVRGTGTRDPHVAERGGEHREKNYPRIINMDYPARRYYSPAFFIFMLEPSTWRMLKSGEEGREGTQKQKGRICNAAAIIPTVQEVCKGIYQ